MSEHLAAGNWVILNRKAGARENTVGIVVTESDQFGYVSVDLGGDRPKSIANDCLLKLIPGRLWCGYDLDDLDNTLRPIVAVRALERMRGQYATVDVFIFSGGYQIRVESNALPVESRNTRVCDSLWAAAMDADQGRWLE